MTTLKLEIFQFQGRDGPQFRDPVQVRRKLELACPHWGEMVDQLSKRSRPLPTGAESLEAKRQEQADGFIEELAKAATAAFGLPPLDDAGNGYPESARITILAEFIAFCAGVLEETRPLADGPPPTG
jgi:hypothetical protein